jgi:hypothetical protein
MIQCLPSKHDALSSNPVIPKTKTNNNKKTTKTNEIGIISK